MAYKKKPLHPYEEAIVRMLRRTRAEMTPTEIGKRLGIHPVTAKKRILRLEKRQWVKCDKVGNRRYCSLIRK